MYTQDELDELQAESEGMTRREVTEASQPDCLGTLSPAQWSRLLRRFN